MSTYPWDVQYSTEVRVDPEFAWRFWTNVENWKVLEPGVEFDLDGPFAPGTWGTTKMPGHEPRRWLIRAVEPGRSWTQEMPLPEAAFMVTMQFEPLEETRTTITQRLWLEGDGAAKFLDAVRMFEKTTPEGLRRIAAVIEMARAITPKP